jgi:hypothetical protein
MAKASFKVAVLPELRSKVLDKERHDGATAGKTTGLKLVHYVTCLLAGNESAKLDDDALAAMLRAEFPKPRNGQHQAIPTWRAYYNGSKHGMNEKGRHSTRYGSDGQPARRAIGEGKAKGKGKGAKAKANGKPAGKGKAKAARKPKAATSEPVAAE